MNLQDNTGEVKLISSDKMVYIIEYRVALLSNTLQIFRDPDLPFIESKQELVYFQ